MSARSVVIRSGFKSEHLQRRRADIAIARRQPALAGVDPQDGVLRRADVDRDAESGDRLPRRIQRPVRAPRLLDEEIEAVLLEDIERVRAPRHRQRAVPHAGRRHAVNPGVVEHPELILRESIEVAAAEPGAIQMDLVKDLEVEVARQARGVLSIGASAGRIARAVRRPRQSPALPRRAHEPGAVQQQTVAAAPVLPGAADAVGDGARRDGERLVGGAIAHVCVESKLVLERGFLERRVLPSEVEPGRQRPGEQRLGLSFPAGIIDAIARGDGNGEEIDARVERRRSELRPLDVSRRQDAGKQQRQLRIGRPELEVEVVDAEDRQRKRVRRIHVDAHRHRLRAVGGAVADHAARRPA